MIGTRSVLVIEPEDDRGGLTHDLRRAGLLVESAGDAGRAAASIASNRPAIVLVDPSTPGLTAAALGEAVRQTRPRPVVLVIIDDLDAVRRGFGADAIHGYIRRDSDVDLAELVRDCLAALGEAKAIAPTDSSQEQISAS